MPTRAKPTRRRGQGAESTPKPAPPSSSSPETSPAQPKEKSGKSLMEVLTKDSEPVQYEPRESDHSRGNNELRVKAHKKLDSLIDLAEKTFMHGEVGVALTFARGVAGVVRSKMDGTDK